MEKQTKSTIKKILFVTAECSGFASLGGLAEVASSLPKAIMNANKRYKVKVVMPLYKKITDNYRKDLTFVGETTVDVAWRKQYVGVYTLTQNGVDYYFIDNKYYFDRYGIYGHFDDGEKFAFFSKSIFKLMELIDFYPNIIHTNDWHTALVNIYLDILYKKEGKYLDIKSIFTIHNIEYQGIFNLDFLSDVIGIDKKYQDLIEYNGLINLIKGAIVCSDLVTTVSPRYSREITTSNYSFGLENIIRLNKNKFVGILNGIDYVSYDPQNDHEIYENYSIDNLENKVLNKTALQKELGLKEDSSIPMLAVISRLVDQKGIDLIIDAMRGFIDLGCQVVILGTGDKYLEKRMQADEYCLNSNVKMLFTYNTLLARKIYAASDIFLMPSRSEPCGLSQMIASRYGTVPVVRSIGGLFDTINDYYENIESLEGNGFTFKEFTANALYNKVKESVDLYKNDHEKFVDLMKVCMTKDFSWNASAKKYIEIYKQLLK